MTETFIGVFAFVFGASAGSFLNVCIARWPHDQSVVSPRSRCPQCGLEIAWYDNIPIISWLMLRARCRGCGKSISVQYPLVELIVALIWLAAALSFGPTFTALRVSVFATVMLGVAITDAIHYLIPDGFTLFGFLFVLATALVSAFRGGDPYFAGPWDSLVGACAAAGVISIIGWLGEVALRKEAMGFGDVTLMAVIGAAVGPNRAFLVLFLAAALGAIVFLAVVYPLARVKRARVVTERGALDAGTGTATPPRGDESAGSDLPHVPFGVFLAPASVVALLWGDQLISWYIQNMMGVS